MDYRYNSSNNTSPAVHEMKSERPRYKTSFFNISKMKHINGTIGTIMPIDWFPVFPGDSLNLDYIIDTKLRNPLSKNAMTGFKVYVHAYFCKSSDLWEGAENFHMKGDTGQLQLEKPYISPYLESRSGEATVTYLMNTPMSLFDYLDCPSRYYDSSGNVPRLIYGYGIRNDSFSEIVGRPKYDCKLDALPFVMYQKIYISKYMNYNLVQENRHFVPLNQRHLILGYNVTGSVNVLDYSNAYMSSIPTYMSTPSPTLDPDSKLFVPTSSDPNTPVYLGALRYRQFEGDYFTTASPFDDLVRGGLPDLSFRLSNVAADVPVTADSLPVNVMQRGGNDFTGNYYKTGVFLGDNLVVGSAGSGGTFSPDSFGEYTYTSPSTLPVTSPQFSVHTRAQQLASGAIGGPLIANIPSDFATTNAVFSMDDLYTIESLTLFRRRNALTNGRYNELVQAQFGINPKADHFEPIYLGGSTFDLLNQTIIQTSQSSQDSQLGQLGGQMSGSGYCRCGHLYSNDFGYVMVLMSVIPDTYYVDGLPRKFSILQQKDVYNSPLLNQLPPDTILNRELFYSGEQSVDEDLFAWKERFAEYKSRQNSVHGLMAVPTMEDSAYVAQRKFDETPVFNNSFVSISPGNVDMNLFSVSDEPPFIFSVGCSVRGRRPFPFASLPGGSNNPNLG